jgi:hypothetical protein
MIGACGSSSRSTSRSIATPAPVVGSTTRARSPGAHPRRRARNGTRRGTAPVAGSVCPPAQDALAGVYHPGRLTVLHSCQSVSGTVEEVRVEQDGDLHYDIQVDPSFGQLLSAGNYAEQHGWLVIELMPRDGGHLPAPSPGDHVELVGAFVDDTEHSWHEIHPVWSEAINGGPARISGPQYGGTPPSDRSYDAAADCQTPSGTPCTGYAQPSSSSRPTSPSGPRSPTASNPRTGASCTVSASYNSSYRDYDVYVHSNQPDQTVTVSDTAGDSHSYHTDSAGYADVYLRVSGTAAGQHVTAQVGGATCSTTLS